MTTYQNQHEVYVAYKAQSARGTAATGTGATVLPLTGGRAQLTKKAIASAEVRRDGLSVRGRHGSQASTGSYPGELQLTNYNSIVEAIMRGTLAAGTAITEATGAMSSATLSVAGNVITFSGGSVITAGVRMYDVLVFTSALDAGDLGRPLRVVGLTDTTITVAETITDVAGPVSSYSFGVKGYKLVNPAAGSLVQRYFTIEEALVDAGVSEVYSDCKWGKLDIGMQPDGMITITPAWTGTGQASGVSGGGSPYFSTPTDPAAALPLTAIDATLRIGSTDLVDLTAFSLSLDLGLNAPSVVGAKHAPDVFDGTLKVSGSLTALRSDLSYYLDFLNETPLTLSVLATVPGSSPTDFVSLVVPNFTLGQVDKSEFKRDAGPLTETLTIPAELVGIDDAGTGHDATMVKWQFSN